MVAGCTYLDLYNQYVPISQGTGVRPYSYRHFLDVVQTHFPEITKSRQTQFTQCSVCNLLHTLRSKPGNDEYYNQIDTCFRQHIQHMLLQRQLYAKRIHLSTSSMWESLSVAIDTMSQFKTQFPNTKGRQTADTRDLARLACATTLSRVHGVTDLFYLNNGAYPKDSNYISGLLIDTLCRVAQSFTANNRPWPKHLFLQLDNATGENKNHNVFATCDLLVTLGIFQQVLHTYICVAAMYVVVIKSE